MNSHAKSLFDESLDQVRRHADRIFCWLMPIQYVALILAAVWLSPLTWAGQDYAVHSHLWTAIIFGALITICPAAFVKFQPDLKVSGYLFAGCQMLVSALLIHLLGGRVEAHFHIFGSLAFLMAYRNYGVILCATVVIAVEHLARSVWMPYSIFGVESPALWRAFEHAGWVVFEDTVLIVMIQQGRESMRKVAVATDQAETTHNHLREDVARLEAVVRDAASGDLTQSVDCESELGALKDLNVSINSMLGDLRSIVSDINSESSIVRNEATEASNASETVSTKIEAQQQAIENIEQAVGRLMETIETLGRFGVNLNNMAEDAGKLASAGAELTKRSNEAIEAMDRESRMIQGGLTEIREIAEQTTLLSLNATIEAARAGESGKGFAVVAEEVKALSTRCNDSAAHLEELINSSAKSVQAGVTESRATTQQFQALLEALNGIGTEIHQIDDISDSQKAVAENVCEATKAVVLACRESSEVSQDILHRCGRLNESSERLGSKVERFQI